MQDFEVDNYSEARKQRAKIEKLVVLFVVLAVCIFLFVFFYSDIIYFFYHIKSIFKSLHKTHPIISCIVYFFTYLLTAELSIPLTNPLTILSGSLFGFWIGIILSSFASAIGATLSFLTARYLFTGFIKKYFPKRIKLINKGIDKEGSFYLFSLRMLPIIPYSVINLVMGVTKINIWKFYIVSQTAMLVKVIVYVNAGTQLAKVKSAIDIFSPQLIISFILIGLLPIITKRLVDYIKLFKRSRKIRNKYKNRFIH
ncbi:MAG: VTT domain-containing protein [Psittacicella sp.]